MFKNMKVGIRLTLAFTVAVLFTVAVSILAIVRMGEMADVTDRIINDRYQKVINATKVIENVNFIGRALRDAVLFNDTKLIEAEIDQIYNERKKINVLIEQLEATVKSQTGRELFGKLKENRQRFVASSDKMIDFARRNADAEAVDYLTKEFLAINTAYLDSINNLIKHQDESMVEGGKEAEASVAVVG